MQIYRISVLADDAEDVYDGLKKALDYLDDNSIGKTKIEIKKAIKVMEKLRPHLKYKDRPVRGASKKNSMRKESLDGESEILKQKIIKYKPELILLAIKRLGEWSIAGFNDVREEDVNEVLDNCEKYELFEILSVLGKGYKNEN